MSRRPFDGGNTRLRWPRSLRRARLSLLLLAGVALIVWDAAVELREIGDYQRNTLLREASGTADDISLLIDEQSARIQLFADSHRWMLLDSQNGGERARQQMLIRLREHFPFTFAYAVTSANGIPLSPAFELPAGHLYTEDIVSFAAGRHHAITLHPSPSGYHYDLMAHIMLANGEPGVLVISQSVRPLAELLAQRGGADVSLFLVAAASPDTIGVSASGDRSQLQRPATLTAAERSNSLPPTPITDSRWQVLALPDLDKLGAARGAVYAQSSLILLVFLLLVAITRAYRRAARERRAALDLVDLASESTGSMIWEWDLTSDHIFSPGHNRLAPPALAKGTSSIGWSERVHPEEREALAAALEAHRRGELEPLEIEHRFRGAFGDWRWLLMRSHIIERDLRGDPSRAVGICTDITARKQDEAKLHAAAERTQATLASIADAVISTDAEGRIDYLNPVAEALTGYSLDEARRRPLAEIIELREEHDRRLIEDPVAQCLSAGQPSERDDCLLLTHDNREYAVRLSAAPMRDHTGEPLGMVLALCDTTRARHRERRMLYHATHDPLTGLANRHQFNHRVIHAIDSAQRHGHHHVLCYLDLDNFREHNERFGHLAGDALLKQIAGMLGHRLRNRDTLARFGGDEFALLLENCPAEQGRSVARQIVQELAETAFAWQQQPFAITASLGMVMIDPYVESRSELLAQANQACTTAKNLGRNQVYVCDPSRGKDHDRDQVEIRRAAELRGALDEGRFELFGQPIVALNDCGDSRRHLEVLLRLQDRDGGLVSPQAFVSAAERYDLMPLIDRWVIYHVFEACSHSEADAEQTPIEVSINLSGSSLGDDSLLDYMLDLLHHGSPPGYQLCFEITETTAISNLAAARRFMSEMQARGCRFALDDFGSGLSSFGYLKSLPVDYLKIDGSFVQQLDDDPIDRAMVAAIHQVGEIMGIPTVAEYVEREALIEDLRAIGVDFGQGTALGAPRPLKELLAEYRTSSVLS